METALLLIAHGSRQPEANTDLHHVADGLRRRGHAVVEAAFLELAEPDIDEAGRACARGAAPAESYWSRISCRRASTCRRDLTAARDRLAARFPGVEFRLAEPLGRHPLLLEVVEERVRETIKE